LNTDTNTFNAMYLLDYQVRTIRIITYTEYKVILIDKGKAYLLLAQTSLHWFTLQVFSRAILSLRHNHNVIRITSKIILKLWDKIKLAFREFWFDNHNESEIILRTGI